jgi:hypothetical protein
MKLPPVIPSIFILLLGGAEPAAMAGVIPVAPQVGAPLAPAPQPRKAGMAPLRGIHAYVCGLHFYNGRMERQVIAHHFCAHVDEDLMQCVIYDSDRRNARLIGIEYVISARRFRTLSADEKRLWHSHGYEVKSGLLMAPLLGEAGENLLMKDFAATYGKTWHTWQVDRGDPLPLGIPQLMMGFTGDGQADPGLVAQRDQDLGLSTEAKRRQRTDLPTPEADPAADAWRTGAPLQLELRPQGPNNTWSGS